MCRKNKKYVAYLLILCIVLMPLQSLWASSFPIVNSTGPDWSPNNNSSHSEHGSFHQTPTKSVDDYIAVKASSHCNSKQDGCNQCDSCSHCLNLLDSSVIPVKHQPDRITTSYSTHYKSIDQSSLFRPPIRS